MCAILLNESQGDELLSLVESYYFKHSDMRRILRYKPLALAAIKRDYQSSLTEIERILETDPNDYELVCWLIEIRAAAPDRKLRDLASATKIAKKLVLEARGTSASAIAAYAVTLAANGDFDAAVANQREAASRANAEQTKMWAGRIDLYKSHRPFVLPQAK